VESVRPSRRGPDPVDQVAVMVGGVPVTVKVPLREAGSPTLMPPRGQIRLALTIFMLLAPVAVMVPVLLS
jgi:hypothetical protein